MDARIMYNPGGVPQEEIDTPRFPAEYVEHAFLAGTPETVAEGIHQLKQAGVRNLMLNFNVGELTAEQVENSLRLFGSKVLPQFSD
jgi:alkanesulfonate monooxygenase SsuD/methylene tetrahydromethanopterin reductase-like flavin-dependent oxidoreductase (luciferase family)